MSNTVLHRPSYLIGGSELGIYVRLSSLCSVKKNKKRQSQKQVNITKFDSHPVTKEKEKKQKKIKIRRGK